MTAGEELEKFAVKYATEATQADQQGAKSIAITQYRRAVEVLLKLCSLYPKTSQNRIYMERVEAYRQRIKALQSESSEGSVGKTEDRPAKFEHAVLSEKPNVKWDEIANLVNAKRAIQDSIIYPARRPDLFPLGWPRGILLFGPPGCGKTLIAAAIATEIEATFFCVDAASVMSKWLGESEKNVAQLFQNARKAAENGQPAIMFIDEVDSLVGVRQGEVGGETRTRNQFLKEIDGITDKNTKRYVYIIGATNKPWALDEPFIRRFQKRIFIPLPDLTARLEMAKLYSKSLNFTNDFEIHELAKLTGGYSGADIRDIFQSVQIRVVREFFESTGADNTTGRPRPIGRHDFQEVLNDRKPSVSQETLRFYDKWFDQFKAL